MLVVVKNLTNNQDATQIRILGLRLDAMCLKAHVL